MNPYGISRNKWANSNPTIIDYHHQRAQESASSPPNRQAQNPGPLQSNREMQRPVSNSNIPSSTSKTQRAPDKSPKTSFASPTVFKTTSSFPIKYDPFFEDNHDIEISDDENSLKKARPDSGKNVLEKPVPIKQPVEVKSGAAFYRGLILFIPPFEQLTSPAKGSPAMKMLYASFEFSFKRAIKIETKQIEGTNVMEATVMYNDHTLCTGSGWAPHIDASVRALELLSETCFTVQAKEDYFSKCKLVNAETMKTLNLKRWEALGEKHPKLMELTKESHIQKTFSVFLDNHTSSETYEDIVCCNLTRQDVNHIKRVVEYFQLTMLPCSISTNLSKKDTPCVVSIHKYTSAQRLLDALIENGGENDNFTVYPPDTFKDFYKLHPNYWDPNSTVNKEEFKTTLEDDGLQMTILKPYENTICDLFKMFKALPKVIKDDESQHKGDDSMIDTLKIDLANSKKVAPVERMQLLLKYMEKLQEYGSRVLTSGQPEKIRIYHQAIDNLRKDLETCRKDIEKDQKDKSSGKTSNTSRQLTRASSPRRKSPPRRRTSPRRRSKSPVKRSTRKSPSPKRRSPKRTERRRSTSPRRRPTERPRSPRSTRVPFRGSPPRKARSPPRRAPSPPRRPSNIPSVKQDDTAITIFKDQFKRFVDILRRFRIEIENTPAERRAMLRERFIKIQGQYDRFHKEISENMPTLGHLVDEMEICREELAEQIQLLSGKPCASDLPPPAATHQPPATFTYPLPQYRSPYITSTYGSPAPLLPTPPTFRYPF